MKLGSSTRLAVIVFVVLFPLMAVAATPESGTIADKQGEVTWTGGPFYASNPATNGGLVKQHPCDVGSPSCDSFRLTVSAGGVKQILIAIAPAAGFEADDYDLYVYNDQGVQVGADADADGRESTVISATGSAYFDVRVQAYTVLPGSSYSALAQPERGQPVDVVTECLELIPENIGSVIIDGGQMVDLSVMMLLDGTDATVAQQLFAKAAESYRPLNINLRLVKTKAVTFTSTVSTDLIAAAKATVGGVPPKGIDVVGVLTNKTMQSATGGAGTVVGQADCIGGIRWDSTSFFVATDIRAIENPTTGTTGTLNSMGLNPNVDAASEVIAHEIGHLIGAHHHYGNCTEGLLTSGGPNDVSPCTLMFPAVNFASLNFSTLEGAVVRGHAVQHASP
jgi:Metallo-peptidase family M12